MALTSWWPLFIGLFVVKSATADEEFFPLLMPKIQPSNPEAYVCTPGKRI